MPMPDERLATIEARVAAYVDRAGIPALALGIVEGDELVLARGFGTDEDGAPVTPDTLFPSCSTGKTFTGTAVMRLVEQGALQLDRPVVDVLHDLALPKGAETGAITLRHLLSHRSGLPSDPEVPRRLFGSAPDRLAQHVRKDVSGYGPALPPDRVTWYSNVGFSIAGRAAEVATGTSFQTLVHELVFEPLGMDGTSYDPELLAGASRVALPGWAARPAGAELPIPYPAGGALTCVRDLARFASMHLSQGEVAARSLLRPETVAEMHRAQGDAFTREPRRYGLAFDVEAHRGLTLVTHGGGGMGCGSAFALVPEHRLGVIALFNHPAGHGVRVRPMLDALLDLSVEGGPDPEPARERWPRYVGAYTCSGGPPPGYPEAISVERGAQGLELIRDGQRSALRVLDEPVYVTEDGSATAGFVPAPESTELLMYDAAGIGLVSVWPYRRRQESA